MYDIIINSNHTLIIKQIVRCIDVIDIACATTRNNNDAIMLIINDIDDLSTIKHIVSFYGGVNFTRDVDEDTTFVIE